MKSIYPTGMFEQQRVEALIISNFPLAVEYVKYHYSKRDQKISRNSWAVIFNTTNEVKRAINHLTKKFKFDYIENWD